MQATAKYDNTPDAGLSLKEKMTMSVDKKVTGI